MVKNSILQIRNVIGILVLLVSPLAPISPLLSKASAATPPIPEARFTVLAAGERSVVFEPTILNTPVENNGSGWYLTDSGTGSMGFAPAGASIYQNSADTSSIDPSDPNSNKRLSWHTSNGNMISGWRAGVNIGLGANWNRFIYQADTLPSYYPSGPQVNVGQSSVTGWTLCYQGTYNDSVALASLFDSCTGQYIMYAASVTTHQKMDVKQNGVSLLDEVGGNYNGDSKVFPGSTVNLSLYEDDGVTPVNWNTYKAYVSNCNYNDCSLDNPQNDTSPTSWDDGTLTSGTYTIPAGSDYRSIVFFPADDETGDYVPGSNFIKINVVKAPEIHMITDCEQLFSIDTDFGYGSSKDIYKLGNDIDCSSVENPSPLYYWEEEGSLFGGILDGQGHTIRNLNMNNSEESYFGLFAETDGATIKNLNIEDSTMVGYDYVGSLIGYSESTSVINVQSSASVDGQNSIGGLIGEGYNVTITDSSATGDVTAPLAYGENIGGIVGSLGNGGTVTRSLSTGSVRGQYSVGGFIGSMYDSATVSYSAAAGAVYSDVDEGSGTGGFIGRNGEGSHIYESLATGYVEGYSRVGGFAGANGGLIENAYARGDVTGNNNVGGFAGRCGGDITNAFSTGFIEGSGGTGGFLGSNQGCDVINSYWDIEQSNTEDSAAGTGKTTAEMIQQATFEGWDFNEVWIIDPSTNDSYPSFLKFGEDNDLDGVPSLTEETGPNGGDSNDDGIADKYQENVTSLPNVNSSSYIVLETSCGTGTKNKDVSVSSEDESKKDAAYNYAQGLVSFKIKCQDIGGTASVSVYFYGVSSKDGLVLRKFNPVTGAYTIISDPTLTILTIDGQSVLKASYSITDGGPLDQDGIADGTITDPVGLGSPIVAVPNTGL